MSADDKTGSPGAAHPPAPGSHVPAHPFFTGGCRLLPADSGALPYYLATFQTKHYSPELFSQYGIDFPPHIRSSVTKRQVEFFAGRLCARMILDAYGLERHAVATGKQREPLWPEGLVGSITHSGGYAAAVVCVSKEMLGIGIDIETIVASDARQALIDLVVSARELAFLRSHEGTLGLDCLLTLAFSAKESFFKAAFPQVKRYFDFDAVEIVGIDEAQGLIAFRVVATLSAGLTAGQVHSAHFDFIGGSSVFTAVLLRNNQGQARLPLERRAA